jgi:hypothetical protein
MIRTLPSLLIALLLAGAALAADYDQPWCLVRCGDGSCGSGTLVDRNDKLGLVVTANHVVRDVMCGGQQAGSVRCEFTNGIAYRATIASVDTKYDLCALVIHRPEIRAKLLGAYTGRGQHRVYGFPHAGRLAITRGRIVDDKTEMFSPGDYYIPVLSSETIEGQSGGAVVDDKGAMVGIMWGNDNGARMTCGKPFDSFMAKLTQCYSCQGGQCWQPSPYYSPGGKQIYEGGPGQVVESTPVSEPVATEPVEPQQPVSNYADPQWVEFRDKMLALVEANKCQCDHTKDVTQSQFNELSQQVVVLSQSTATLAENVQAISTANATINQTIQKMKPYVPPTPQQQAEAIQSYLKHSATITLLDGTTKTQTKPLSEALEFIQHTTAVKQ